MVDLTTVGCFIEHDGKILALRRSIHEAAPGKWGLPAGKIDGTEHCDEAIVREIEEEIGVKYEKDSFEYIGTWLWKLPDVNVTFSIYKLLLNERPDITLNPMEHDAYKWMTPEEFYYVDDLLAGNREAIRRAGYIGVDEPYVESKEI